ncbi:hypothetical protein [Cognatiluteimonas profundi]|uniref:hypothetical protein n=1 Tax=Cognatiluteimonas profundi TaxID=2594501 RepID=UPI00131E4949|nr:hypothetical protein [Lysobacter profundi]
MAGSFFAEIRALHIIVAAAWFGAAAFVTLYLMPAMRQVGPQGGPVMQALDQRKFHVFMAANAGLTVLSGCWLYWTLTAGLQPGVVHSPMGVVFGLGGLAGLLAAILGAAVIGRNVKRLALVAGKAATGDPSAAGEMAALQQRIRTASRLVLMLMVAALLSMTLGHSV